MYSPLVKHLTKSLVLSKFATNMNNVELKKKVTLKRKGKAPALASSSQPKESKWWLWFLPIIVIGVIVMIIRSNPSDNDNTSTTANTAEPAVPTQVANEVTTNVVQTESPSNSGQSQTAVTPALSEQSIASAASNTASNNTKTNNEPTTTSADNTQKPTTSVPTSVAGVEDKAWEVIKGRFGNGVERKQMLGIEYETIQQKVNEFYKAGHAQ